jgi:hypothetical protein
MIHAPVASVASWAALPGIGSGGVEVGEALDAGEAGLADAAGPPPAGPVVEFGGQDLG